MISGLANPAVLAATVGGLVVGKFANDAMDAHDYRAGQQEIHAFNLNRGKQIDQKSFGDNQVDRSQEAAALRKQLKKEIDDAHAAENTTQLKGFGDMLIGGGQALNKIPGLGDAIPIIGASAHLETSVDRARRESKEKIARLQSEIADTEARSNREAMAGPAGLEMARIKAKLSGNMQGAREADYKSFMMQKEAEEHHLGLTGTFNDEFVNLAARERLRDEQMRIGARLVNARSGNADVLRASQIASGQFGGADAGRLEKLIADQTHQMNRNHEEAKQHLPRTFNLVPNLRGQL